MPDIETETPETAEPSGLPETGKTEEKIGEKEPAHGETAEKSKQQGEEEMPEETKPSEESMTPETPDKAETPEDAAQTESPAAPEKPTVPAINAAAIALKNIMGLVWDPVAGLVECPCEKRNAIGAANAVLSCDLALAGIESLIPFDEVVSAVAGVGAQMHADLRETARGGLAATPTAQRLARELTETGQGGA